MKMRILLVMLLVSFGCARACEFAGLLSRIEADFGLPEAFGEGSYPDDLRMLQDRFPIGTPRTQIAEFVTGLAGKPGVAVMTNEANQVAVDFFCSDVRYKSIEVVFWFDDALHLKRIAYTQLTTATDPRAK